MTEKTKNKRLRLSLSKKQQVLLVLALTLITGLIGYGWYRWQNQKAEASAPKAGINTTLPDAKLAGQDPADKMAYYDQAGRDSVKEDTSDLSLTADQLGFNPKQDQRTLEINEKLNAINQALASPQVVSPSYSSGTGNRHAPIAKDVDRLESLMRTMQQGDGEDVEMKQLGGMMDKLLVLQNPELAKQIYKKDAVNMLTDSLFKAVPAVISKAQKARQGSVVELRLQDTLVINGQVVPKGHLLYGLASFSNQRLNLEIKNIRLGTSIIPVDITVFDQRDGMAGINAPEAMLTDAVNGGITDAAGSIGITGFDLTTQLAGAGIDAARSLLIKKVGRVKQNLKSGYPLLLRDNTKKMKITSR